jgi:hypothetical protein
VIRAVSRSLILLAILAASSALVFSQSSDQLFPTPVRSREIVSTIKARDIGDSRLTSYYYTFEGEQGDVFINVQSRSFTGDIDLFIVPTQTPLTKIVIYADQAETETGRVVYLRKPERLMLRVQGRTPGDDEAVIRIKFAGSFVASRLDESDVPEVPKAGTLADTDVRVNSVGTILEVKPKVKPTPETVAEEPRKSEEDVQPTADEKVSDAKDLITEKQDDTGVSPDTPSKKVEVVITDPVTENTKKPTPTRRVPANRRNTARRVAPPKSKGTDEAKDVEKATPAATTRNSTAVPDSRSPAKDEEDQPKADPMENVRLVIYFKDGSTIDRPMNDVQRFAVERAILTVIHKNGSIGRYNMVDVLRVSIE